MPQDPATPFIDAVGRLAPALADALFAQSPISVALYDRAGRVALGNEAYERHFGVRVADVAGSYSLFDDAQLEAAGILPLVRRAYEGEVVVLPPVRYDAAAATGAGRTVWTQGHCYPVRDAAGEVTHVAVLHVDVTGWAETEAALRTAQAQLEARNAELLAHGRELERLNELLQGNAAELRESEARYRNLFERIDDGFCVIEVLFDEADRPVDYRFVEANPAFVQQTGLANAVGRTMRELAPGLETHWFEAYGRVARTGEPVRFEASAEALGRWFDVYAFRVGEPGESRVAVLFADSTAGREAERERARLLRELEVERARLTYVFEHAPAFLAVLRGPQHVLELANAAYYQLVGHRELVGKPVVEALPEVRDQGFEALLDRVLATGEPFVGREAKLLLTRTPGGPPEERYLDFAYIPVVEGDGTRTGVIAHGTDVTEHVLARREVEVARERAERLQTLTAALAAARTVDEIGTVVVADMVVALGARTGAMGLVDREAGELVIVREAGFAGIEPWHVMRQRLDLRAPAAECARTGEPVWIEGRDGPYGFDRRYPDLTGAWDTLGVESAAFVPLVAGGESVGMISFAFTAPHRLAPAERGFLRTLGQQAALAIERARLFEAERAARAEAEGARAVAEAASQARSDFLATMSHEIRTPINAIVGYTQLLELGIPDPATPAQRGQLARITSSAQHLLGLVNDVLDVAKIDAGEMRVTRDEAGAAAVMHDALALARPLADAAGVRIVGPRLTTDRGAPGADVCYVGDAARVRQILVNLLSNAVKFTPAGGTVTVSAGTTASAPPGVRAEAEGPLAYLRVADTGVGIAPEQQGAIFEPFVQAERGHTRTKGGTGLGLTISRRLARLMGGDLTLESVPGEGTTFTLWLPAAVGAPGEAAPSAGRDESDRGVGSGWRVPGLAEIGRALREEADVILAAYTAALRADPATPLAREMPDAQLEDHAITLLADLAQSLVIIDDPAADAAALMADGTAIQRTIAEHHGARRRAQGWTEAAVRRDHEVMRAEVERAVRARIAPRAGDVVEGLRVLAGLQERTAALSLAAYRRAGETGGTDEVDGMNRMDEPRGRAGDA